MLRIFFAAGANQWLKYDGPLQQALTAAGINASVTTTAPKDPTSVDYIIFAPGGSITDFSPYKLS
eukprot:m.44020 g.44020  ORF g.44020 m.44020 type:complete len:65 (+) comp10036_c0_seq2:218-412(+)